MNILVSVQVIISPTIALILLKIDVLVAISVIITGFSGSELDQVFFLKNGNLGR